VILSSWLPRLPSTAQTVGLIGIAWCAQSAPESVRHINENSFVVLAVFMLLLVSFVVLAVFMLLLVSFVVLAVFMLLVDV